MCFDKSFKLKVLGINFMFVATSSNIGLFKVECVGSSEKGLLRKEKLSSQVKDSWDFLNSGAQMSTQVPIYCVHACVCISNYVYIWGTWIPELGRLWEVDKKIALLLITTPLPLSITAALVCISCLWSSRGAKCVWNVREIFSFRNWFLLYSSLWKVECQESG